MASGHKGVGSGQAGFGREKGGGRFAELIKLRDANVVPYTRLESVGHQQLEDGECLHDWGTSHEE